MQHVCEKLDSFFFVAAKRIIGEVVTIPRMWERHLLNLPLLFLDCFCPLRNCRHITSKWKPFGHLHIRVRIKQQ